MKDRIRQLMESQHMNQQSFAAAIGLSPATLSSILQERTRPTLATVESLQKKFPNLSLSWIINGEGDMFVTPNQSIDNRAREGEDAFHEQTSGEASAPGLLELDFGAPADQRQSVRQNPLPRQQQPTRQYSAPVPESAKIIDKPARRITEIRVFYDDQTWESFVPKK